ncbi:hypothetical protein ACFLZW_01200 [Chloroflexota bacterium]
MNKRTSLSVYIGTFIIAFMTLAFEITLTRLLSVLTWYHLAFFAISTAMLGMTAGSVTVFLIPGWFSKDRLYNNIAKACLIGAVVIPFSLVMLLLIPHPRIDRTPSIMDLVALFSITLFCTLPFYFSGTAISAILTKSRLSIGRLYASDLIGAALGCLFVLGGLEFFNAPSLILLCGAISALAAMSFAYPGASSRIRTTSIVIFVVMSLAAVANSSTLDGLRPTMVKGRMETRNVLLLEKWNSFSRVMVYTGEEKAPQLWSPSPIRPTDITTYQYTMSIDGEAATFIREFSSLQDIDHLRFDGTNSVYYLRPTGSACVIGLGGGRDVLGAILFGHKRIIGIDINPIFIDLLEGRFREFAGIADYPGVTLVADEARSYFARNELECTVIQMSLIDTWAATGAGAFSLSENSLYTVEAWQLFLSRLSDDGIFTVSRWYSSEDLGEAGRVVSLAVATLLEASVENPSEHIAMVGSGSVSTILVSKTPFSQEDIKMLKQFTADLQFNLVIIPGIPPKHKVLREIVSAESMGKLIAYTSTQTLNYEPPRDENPYFFNLLRLRYLLQYDPKPGVIQGNMYATFTLVGLLISLMVMALATVVIPLAIKTRTAKQAGQTHKAFWPGAIYFSLIGAGFMLVEIALIQRLSVFLGHPIYALGILLFTIIASSGLGSYLSENLSLTRRPWVYLYPIMMVTAIILARFLLPIMLASFTSMPIWIKAIVSVLVIAPTGVIMGFFFPTGMKLVQSIEDDDTPWYWALNGIFGVLCSALAVLISIYINISTNFYIAALCYSMTLIPIFLILKKESSQTA